MSPPALTQLDSPHGMLDDVVDPNAGGGLHRLFRWPHDRSLVTDIRHGEPMRLLPPGDPVPPLGKTPIRDRARLEDQDVAAHASRHAGRMPPQIHLQLTASRPATEYKQSHKRNSTIYHHFGILVTL